MRDWLLVLAPIAVAFYFASHPAPISCLRELGCKAASLNAGKDAKKPFRNLMIDFTVGGMVAVGTGIKPAPTASASGGMGVTIGTAASLGGRRV